MNVGGERRELQRLPFAASGQEAGWVCELDVVAALRGLG